jgi:RNA polymerase sigma factor (sigma-70 family)
VQHAGAAEADAADFAIAQADPAAFDRLFERYETPILNYCYYRLGTWEEAEDAAQQIFTNAIAGRQRFQTRGESAEGSFRPWLFTIAHHEVANRVRTRARHADAPFDLAFNVADPGPTLDEIAIAADRQDRALALIAQLSADQRQVLELRFAGLTDVEISAVLGRKAGAVRAVQARAVARLREMLGDRLAGDGDGNE